MKKILISIYIILLSLSCTDKNESIKPDKGVCEIKTCSSNMQENDKKDFEKYNYDGFKTLDEKMKFELSKIKVKDKDGKEFFITDILTTNAIVMYGAGWCPDCRKELIRLEQIADKRDIIYLVDSKKWKYDDFINYAKNLKNNKIYFVPTLEIREKFNVKWIPSLFEIKDGIIQSNFIPNNLGVIE